jgi:hypothetical protein
MTDTVVRDITSLFCKLYMQNWCLCLRYLYVSYFHVHVQPNVFFILQRRYTRSSVICASYVSLICDKIHTLLYSLTYVYTKI